MKDVGWVAVVLEVPMVSRERAWAEVGTIKSSNKERVRVVIFLGMKIL